MTLREAVESLIRETEGRADALSYIGDIARDFGISEVEAVTELDKCYELGENTEDIEESDEIRTDPDAE